MTDRFIYFLYIKINFLKVRTKSKMQVNYLCALFIYMFRIRVCREVHISSWQTYSGINFRANEYEQVVIHVYKSIELKLLFESI